MCLPRGQRPRGWLCSRGSRARHTTFPQGDAAPASFFKGRHLKGTEATRGPTAWAAGVETPGASQDAAGPREAAEGATCGARSTESKAKEGAVGPQDGVKSEPRAQEGAPGWPSRPEDPTWALDSDWGLQPRRPPTCSSAHAPFPRQGLRPITATRGPECGHFPLQPGRSPFTVRETARWPLEGWEDALGWRPASPDPPPDLRPNPPPPCAAGRVKASCHENWSPAHPSRPLQVPCVPGPPLPFDGPFFFF